MARCLQDVMHGNALVFLRSLYLEGRGCSETASWAERYLLRSSSLSVHLDNRLDGWPSVLYGRASLKWERWKQSWLVGRLVGRSGEQGSFRMGRHGIGTETRLCVILYKI